jgi:hypothetical protein
VLIDSKKEHAGRNGEEMNVKGKKKVKGRKGV